MKEKAKHNAKNLLPLCLTETEMGLFRTNAQTVSLTPLIRPD